MSSSPAPAALVGAATLFVVEDIERALAHYRDALGFQVDFRYGEPAFYAGVTRGRLCIHLQAASQTKRRPGQGALYVFVTGVDALHAELSRRGARIVKPPADYDYGMRDFDLLDADGNALAFGQDISGTTPAAEAGAPPALLAAAPVFAVADIEAALGHYRDALGFRIDFRYGEPVFYAGIARGEACLHLQAAAESKREAGQGALNVFTDAVDPLFAELRGRGARLLGEPVDRPYGLRTFAALDADGNELNFGQGLHDDEPGQD